MLLMEPNAAIATDVKSGRYGEGIIVEAATSDTARLAALYNAADLMLHASNHGESYGYTVAEAMQAALPVITRATPWGDNAQTELVEHGNTGYVCGSVRGLSNALLELSVNRERSAEFGARGAERIARISSLDHETDILEDVIKGLFEGKPGSLTLRRFWEWIEFIETRNRDTPTCYERDNRDWQGMVRARVYRAWREAKTLKKYYRQRFVRRRNVLFPTRKLRLPPAIRETEA